MFINWTQYAVVISVRQTGELTTEIFFVSEMRVNLEILSFVSEDVHWCVKIEHAVAGEESISTHYNRPPPPPLFFKGNPLFKSFSAKLKKGDFILEAVMSIS